MLIMQFVNFILQGREVEKNCRNTALFLFTKSVAFHVVYRLAQKV